MMPSEPENELDSALALFNYSPEGTKKEIEDLLSVSMTIVRKFGDLIADRKCSAAPLKCAAYIFVAHYIRLQLTRTSEWFDADVDLLAWVARNLLEVRLLVGHLQKDYTNCELFTKEVDIDWKEILEKSAPLRTSSPDMQAEVEQIVQSRATAGLPLKRMALKPSGVDAASYRLQSKYIHPSAWFIIHLEEYIKAEPFREWFHIEIVTEALRSLRQMMDELQSLLRKTTQA